MPASGDLRLTQPADPAAWSRQLQAAPLDTRAAWLAELATGPADRSLEPLLAWLAMRDQEPKAQQDLPAILKALVALKDARAAPALLTLRAQGGQSGLHDEHGGPISLQVLATDTLRQLQRHCPALQGLDLSPPGSVVEPAGAAAHGHSARQPPPPPTAPHPGTRATPARKAGWPRLLGVAGWVAPLWALGVAVVALDPQGHLTPTPAARRTLALVAVAPALLGLAAAVAALRRPVPGAARWAAVGSAVLCGLVLRAFWGDLF